LDRLLSSVTVAFHTRSKESKGEPSQTAVRPATPAGGEGAVSLSASTGVTPSQTNDMPNEPMTAEDDDGEQPFLG
jgi:hypothetical protein